MNSPYFRIIADEIITPSGTQRNVQPRCHPTRTSNPEGPGYALEGFRCIEGPPPWLYSIPSVRSRSAMAIVSTPVAALSIPAPLCKPDNTAQCGFRVTIRENAAKPTAVDLHERDGGSLTADN